MNTQFTQSFQEFTSKLSSMDLALYAGAGLIIWLLFKEQLNPVQKFVDSVINKVTNLVGQSDKSNTVVEVVTNNSVKEDNFFKLIASWKQTRDLAKASGCVEAVQAIDKLFPYLSPQTCVSKEDTAK